MPTKLWVDGLRRRLAAEGEFVTILRKGDEGAGAVILVLRSRAGEVSLFSRTNLGDGSTEWRPLSDELPENDDKLREILTKQIRFDPDLWVVELDVADPARFIVDLASMN
ncbi:DUF1491 family protein [Pacificimonas aurantium]|uniref:DUF1491 family protein n=1 Tax=Pacificimonas aurantium TaxID=1250540 RepID=UPI001CCCA689